MAVKKEEIQEVNEKDAGLKKALLEIQKQFGKESIMTFSSEVDKNIEFVSSGSLTLDLALGGGYAKGRVVEIYGPESSGKTTLALHACAEAQKKGGKVVYIDTENALDPYYAQQIGVDVKNMVISQPDSGEQALSIAEIIMKNNAADVIVDDSVAALVPQAELNGEIGDNFIGTTARLMSQAMKKLAPLASKSNTLLIFINQIRMKIGVMFGNPETTTGGNALKFYASQRLEVRKDGSPTKEGEEIVGNQTKVKVVKNKIAPPFKVANFLIRFGEGISRASEVISLGVKAGLIEKAGSFYSYNSERMAQGEAKAITWLKEHPDIQETLIDKILHGDTTNLVETENKTESMEE